MIHTNTQKGFTLVELAIVMTIIGLLIGGILKGQELMQNARVTATIAQVRAYEAATTTFSDKYDAIPGDMINAANRIPTCNVACSPVAGGGSLPGDGIVGQDNWGGSGWNTQATATGGGAGNETMLFWTHLLLSDLISGITTATITSGTTAFNETHPAAKISGGFVAGFGDNVATVGNGGSNPGPSGMILALVPRATEGPNGTTVGRLPLTPARSAQIDRKMDDGRPDTGYVHAYGVQNSCFSTTITSGVLSYAEGTQTNDCGLIFRIQG